MYLVHTDEDRRAMLAALGREAQEDLFAHLPEEVRLGRRLALPPPRPEREVARHLEDLASANWGSRLVCFAGGGAEDHYVPAVVRWLLGRGEFLTAYTPYQPEVSQGALQALYEFQTAVCELTGMDVANSSLYDGAAALAEGVLLACRATGRRRVLVSRAVNPLWRRVVATYLAGPGIALEEVPYLAPGTDGAGATDAGALAALVAGDVAAVVFQEPNFFGRLEPVEDLIRLAHGAGALAVAACHPVALGVLEPPGRFGADVAVGEGQPLGLAPSFGGPYLGFLAVRHELLRQLPGRIVGATVDRRGRRAFVLTLQAREQHIRRERATSNICTNQALNAIAATAYLAWLGPEGLRSEAGRCLAGARLARRLAEEAGFTPLFGDPFFHEFVLSLEVPAREVLRGMAADGFLGGVDLGRWYPELGEALHVCVTGARTEEEIGGWAASLARHGRPSRGGPAARRGGKPEGGPAAGRRGKPKGG